MAFAIPDARHRKEWLIGWLGPAGWSVVILGAIVAMALPQADGDVNQDVLLVTMTVFFGLLMTRLILSMIVWPARLAALISLAVGVLLWSLASALLNGSAQASTVTFPAPHEWLFLASYVGFSVFLGFDVATRGHRTATAWLDAAIVCGGVGALAGTVLWLPFARTFPDGGLPLFLAVLYPLIDLTLAVFVVGQWALAARSTSRRTISLIGGFVLLAVADASLVLNLSGGTYGFSVVLDFLWAAAFILIVDAACTRPVPRPAVGRRLRGRFLIGSFVMAVVLLLLRPEGVLGWAVAIPAAVALLATGGRLALSQREAQRGAEAMRLARTDDLTDLPNRRALLSWIDTELRTSKPLSLVLIDLDSFKEINDTLDHSKGDALLELVALRMRDALGPDSRIARVGGDEFAVVLPFDDPVALLETAHLIQDAIHAPTRVDGVDLSMRASCGIAWRLPGDVLATEVLRRADVAMNDAKQSHSGTQVYDAERDEVSRQRLRMGEELRRALARGEIVVYYQPKVDALTQLAVGMEALVRWNHPQQGLLPPMVFLPVARRSGLMHELTVQVAHAAIVDARLWQQSGLNIGVAINVAPQELLSGQLLPAIYELRDRVGLPPGLITIEVTEDTFLADPERARLALQDVRAHGLRVSIDDFGTGFSSLAYLRDLPISELKIDRSFVGGVASDERSRLIVASTTDMAHALGFEVVAEGVESPTVSAEVLALGVDVLQGYHIAPPMPSAHVIDWARSWSWQTQQFRPGLT
jgi:diguanylate cyclase (GGDEF)-like protein